MSPHGLLTESSRSPHGSITSGSGREGKGKGREGRCVASMHQPHLGAPTSWHATKREGGWDACR